MFTGCEVDYFGDPNQPEVAPTYGIMNRVQKRLIDDTRDEWFSGRQMLLWVQYWNQVNYTEEDRFQYRETVNKQGWNDLYKNAQDLVDLIDLNVNEETKSDMAKFGPNEAQIAAARVMLVFIYQQATELWGDVPYYSYGSTNESFQANKLKSDEGIFQPVYASQEDIYVDMLRTLDEAQEVFKTATYVIDGDNFYNGDAKKWQKFANSLRLRIANRILGVYAGAQAHIDDAILEGVFSSNADNAGVKYEANAVNGAPMYRAFVVEARNDFAPSMQFVELLKGNNTDFYTNPFAADPRLDVYVADNKNGDKVGIPLTDLNGTVSKFTDESMPGDAILAPDYTEIYMEYSEVCFIMSELNAWDQTWYEAGVRASMEKWGIATAVIDAYIATLPVASEETVMMQKYIALYMQPMEAWSEYRRTGYPISLVRPNVSYDYTWHATRGDNSVSDSTATYIFTPIGGLTDIPTRNKYLLNEANINETNLNAAIAAMGGDAQDTKLWWQP
jgi:hypothetical protein